MRIGYVMMDDPGVLDMTLAEASQALIAQGLRVSGVVQINTEREKGHKCDMDVKVLPDGPIICISQSLGEGATGCRLDPDKLETAVEIVKMSLQKGADVLLVNKFGKHEADGRGFRETIGAALADGIPVLVGLNGLNKAAFEEFSAGFAEHIVATEIVDWIKQPALCA